MRSQVRSGIVAAMVLLVGVGCGPSGTRPTGATPPEYEPARAGPTAQGATSSAAPPDDDDGPPAINGPAPASSSAPSSVPSSAPAVSPPPIAADALLGKQAPTFSLPRVGKPGEKISLAKLRGKELVVLYFFATYVEPAHKALPGLVGLGDKGPHAKNVAFVGVSVDDPEQAKAVPAFVKKFPGLVAVHDADLKIAEAFKPQKLPTAYLIDMEGVVRLVIPGYSDADIGTLETKIAELLKK